MCFILYPSANVKRPRNNPLLFSVFELPGEKAFRCLFLSPSLSRGLLRERHWTALKEKALGSTVPLKKKKKGNPFI